MHNEAAIKLNESISCTVMPAVLTVQSIPGDLAPHVWTQGAFLHLPWNCALRPRVQLRALLRVIIRIRPRPLITLTLIAYIYVKTVPRNKFSVRISVQNLTDIR